MRTPLSAAILAAVLAVCGILTMPTSSVARSATCTDVWNPDGQVGPWYTAPQTLHGNSVHIDCPTQNTAWSVHYLVIKQDGAGGMGTPIDETRSGHGDTSFSISTNPVGCNPGWDYLTKVHNIITGGNIYKPTSRGIVIC